VRKQILTLLLATGASVGGVFTTQPAMAHCTVNLGTCDDSSACTVNLGSCTNEGSCTVNTDIGNCDGGQCTINDGRCVDGACVIASGDCSNEDDALICLNTICDGGGTSPASESYSGFICIWNGGNEASVQDPTLEQGPITAGPWIVTPSDPTTNTVSNVTMTCIMQDQFGQEFGTGGQLASRTNITSGNVGILADVMTFHRTPLTPTYLCTVVEWNSTKGHTVIVDDADNDSSNGFQCVEYTYTN